MFLIHLSSQRRICDFCWKEVCQVDFEATKILMCIFAALPECSILNPPVTLTCGTCFSNVTGCVFFVFLFCFDYTLRHHSLIW